jgi:SPP1 family predicted phage head-tail adaptor
MRAGKLRTYIRIEQFTEQRGAAGGVTRVWTTFATAWAEIAPRGGAEQNNAGRDNSVVDTVIRIRHIDGVTSGMRIVAGVTYYNIAAAFDKKGNREMLTIECSTGANQS